MVFLYLINKEAMRVKLFFFLQKSLNPPLTLIQFKNSFNFTRPHIESAVHPNIVMFLERLFLPAASRRNILLLFRYPSIQ